MSGLGTIALVLAAIWMGLLTLAVVLTIRQVAILMVRLDRLGEGVGAIGSFYDPMAEGPEIGSRLPDEVARSLPELGSGTTHLLLLSATCGPCRDMAEGLGRAGIPKEGRVLALIPGRRELADGLVAMLPAGVRHVRDPQATALARGLSIQRVPFALRVESGTVTAKAPPLDSTADLIQFIEKRATDPGLAAARVDGGHGHGG